MKRAVNLLVILAFVAALAAPGCYTVVSHPKDERGYAASQSSDCLRCHSDYSEFPYGYYYSPYPSHYWTIEKYGLYYAYPWWWDYYDQDNKVYSGRGTKFDPREPHYPPPDYIPPGGYPVLPSIIITNPSWDNTGGSGTVGGKPGSETDTRGKDETADDGKETRQDNVNKPSGPKSDNSTTNDNSDSNNQEEKPSKDSKTKQDRRKGKP